MASKKFKGDFFDYKDKNELRIKIDSKLQDIESSADSLPNLLSSIYVLCSCESSDIKQKIKSLQFLKEILCLINDKRFLIPYRIELLQKLIPLATDYS